ncbi:MAG: hypothetical protein JNL83_08215 [Myxococcales bacterium]|nr:hypothetical protein [Myxococcales bacterium]
MVTRRLFLAMPLLLAAGARAAPRPAWWLGALTGDAAAGKTITARRSAGRTTLGTLERQVTPRSVDITSSKNDNSEFHMWVVFPRQKDTAVFLHADGLWLVSESYGHDDTGSQASFVLDRATAQRMAKALGVPLHERAELGDGLVASWSFPAKASSLNKDPVTVKLVVKNAGKTTVGFVIGGRQRGPRDNRFSFSVSRNGTPVKLLEAHDFGGISYYKPLGPGESVDLSVDLRSWAELALPGHYQIDARYEGELAKDGVMPQTAAERKHLWDLTLRGQGGILVQ